ncbi:alkaline phosphatase D family protein [Nonomuraea sp. NPDC048916]|uniref:alkaline phosphatase D family protein n=1 Tax=Nonomuraea sp. NPDC048916 TaxID=3154232 RepID=UPI0033CA4582
MATFHMLGTRQYRDDQGCGDGYRGCPEAVDPSRSITGAEQEQWLLDGFRHSLESRTGRACHVDHRATLSDREPRYAKRAL